MTTIAYEGTTLTVVYVDPDIAVPGAGATPGAALNALPAPASLAANTLYLVRRSDTGVTLTTSAQTWSSNSSHIWGMPTATEFGYDLMPAEAITAWDADVALRAIIRLPTTSWYMTITGNYKSVANIRFEYPATGTDHAGTYNNYISTLYNTSGSYYKWINISARIQGVEDVTVDTPEIQQLPRFLQCAASDTTVRDLDLRFPCSSTVPTSNATGYGGGYHYIVYVIGQNSTIQKLRIIFGSQRVGSSSSSVSYGDCTGLWTELAKVFLIEDVHITAYMNTGGTANQPNLPVLIRTNVYSTTSYAQCMVRRIRAEILGDRSSLSRTYAINSSYLCVGFTLSYNVTRMSDISVRVSNDYGPKVGQPVLIDTTSPLLKFDTSVSSADVVIENVDVYTTAVDPDWPVVEVTAGSTVYSPFAIVRGLSITSGATTTPSNHASVLRVSGGIIAREVALHNTSVRADNGASVFVDVMSYDYACRYPVRAGETNPSGGQAAVVYIRDGSRMDPTNISASIDAHVYAANGSRVVADVWGYVTTSAQAFVGSSSSSDGINTITLYNIGNLAGNILTRTNHYILQSTAVRRVGSASNMSLRFISTATPTKQFGVWLPNIDTQLFGAMSLTGRQRVVFHGAYKNIPSFTNAIRDVQIHLTVEDGDLLDEPSYEAVSTTWENDVGLTTFALVGYINTAGPRSVFFGIFHNMTTAPNELYIDPVPVFEVLP